MAGRVDLPEVSAQLGPALAPSSAAVRALLYSSEPQDQAWGAWLAGQQRLVDAAVALEQLAERYVDAAEPLGRIVQATALDALIELDALPAADLLAKIYPTFPIHSLILLSRLGAEADPVLRRILPEARSESWFAIANLLHQRKATGFAILLLQDLQLTARIDLSDHGDRGSVEGGREVFNRAAD